MTLTSCYLYKVSNFGVICFSFFFFKKFKKRVGSRVKVNSFFSRIQGQVFFLEFKLGYQVKSNFASLLISSSQTTSLFSFFNFFLQVNIFGIVYILVLLMLCNEVVVTCDYLQ